MLSGAGRIFSVTRGLKDTSLGREIFFPGLFSDFNFDVNNSPKKAKAWIDGKKRTVSSDSGDEEVELTVAFEYLDWKHLQYATQELAQTSNNVQIPIWKQGFVSSSNDLVDADIAGLTTEQEEGVFVYVNERGSWGEAGDLAVVTTTPNAGEFQIDKLNSKLVFNAAEVGASITYVIPKPFTTSSIGREANYTKFGKQEFWGLGYGPEFPNGVYLHLPDVTVTQLASFKVDDGVPKWELKFECNVPRGGRSAYEYHRV
ncbi:MAG: hypothetical protein AB4290_09800 [Spirulina sp.]